MRETTNLTAKNYLLFACLSLAFLAAPAKALDAQRKKELHTLLIQDCGSCHGLYMKGGLGPALTPQALTSKNLDYLTATILHGRPGTAMPPWQALLSEEEAQWLAEQLINGVKP